MELPRPAAALVLGGREPLAAPLERRRTGPWRRRWPRWRRTPRAGAGRPAREPGRPRGGRAPRAPRSVWAWKTSGTIRPLSAVTPSRPTPCCSNRERLSSSSRLCVLARAQRGARHGLPLARPARRARPSGSSPAPAATTSDSPCSSSISSVLAETSARPRLATSSSTTSRSVSPPSARAICGGGVQRGDRALELVAAAARRPCSAPRGRSRRPRTRRAGRRLLVGLR